MGTIATVFETGEKSALKGHFHNLVMLSRIDGKVEDSEQKLLNRLAKKLSLTDDEIKTISEDEHNYPLYPPVSKEDRLERLIQLIEMILIDGTISNSEDTLITKYGIALGFDEDSLALLSEEIIAKIKQSLNTEEILSELL